MTTALRQVAAFDVDGTLTTRDCVVPFLRRVAGTPRLVGGVARHPVRLGRASVSGDRDTLKQLATAAALTGRRAADVAAHGDAFAAEVHAGYLRSESVRSLDRHREAGDAVVLVSASFEVYLEPLARLLGADQVLGTRLEVGPEGLLTGRLDGRNCRGPEKVDRLRAWIEERFGGRSAVRLVAYGDSTGDRELLAEADEAHWVVS